VLLAAVEDQVVAAEAAGAKTTAKQPLCSILQKEAGADSPDLSFCICISPL